MEQCKVSLFDIPLVLDEIASRLELKDLQHCVRVSRSFWSSFVPYLWRDVHFDSLRNQERLKLDDPNSPFLLTSDATPAERREYYHHSIRSIHLSASLAVWPNVSDSPCFPNLRRFRLRNQNRSGEDDPTFTVPHVLSFLAVHWNLQSIELSDVDVGHDFGQRFQAVMAALPYLTQLVLDVNGKLSFLDHLSLLEDSQRLERLHLSIDSSLFEYHDMLKPQIELYSQRMKAMKPEVSKIKDLFLNTEHFATVMGDYMQRCPLLERLTVRTMLVVKPTLDLADIIQDHCPRLRHLDVRSLHLSDNAQARMIVACRKTEEQSQRKSGLESLKIRPHKVSAETTLNAILLHRATLTSIAANQGKGLAASGLQLILTNCVNLRSLTVKLVFSDTLLIPIDEIEGERWNCPNLRSLALLSVDYCTSRGRDDAADYLRYFYRQAGMATTLETLLFQLSNAEWVPTRVLFSDGIKEFHNLKRLRVFGFHKEEASLLKKHHVELMLQMWPKLEQLGGLLDHYCTSGLAAWLTKARPDLELSSVRNLL
ncbi:hypothetical protein EDD21DRAFT_350484 [Dissophora ornata]|nr:hypothetical protein BGZ58_004562 [Dissophora ornata]KAI8604927.1 hypothetical protein EDD21DRAFT_350484 [Dissophora ornata]